MQRLDYNKIKELHAQNLNDNEIARALKASVNGIRYARKNVLKLPNIVKNDTISQELSEIIVGTLLGDAWVGYVHKNCTAPKYQVIHSIKQEQYTALIFKKLSNIAAKTLHYSKGTHTVTIKNATYICAPTVTASSRNCKSLIPYREAFYPNGKKIIPIEFIKDKFTVRSLAFWYMDDGSYDKHTNSYIINTQCFTKENLQEFLIFLEDKFSLRFNIKKDNSLYLKHECNDLFVNLIRSYLTEDMLYKVS